MNALLKFTLVRFSLVGVVNCTIGLLVIYSAMLLGAGNAAANALGYGVGILVSFALNRQWTFGARGGVGEAFFRYLLVVAVAYFANLGSVLFLIDSLGVNGYIAQACGVPVYTLAVYAGCRFFVFPRAEAGK